MIFKTLLLLISISSFLSAGFIAPSGEGKEIFHIKIFILLFISFISLTVFFLKSRGFQEKLEAIIGKKFIIALFSIGSIFFLTQAFMLHGEDGDYVISTALDPIAYFIQAKIFSTGHINVPSHELKDFFSTGYFINDGKYYSMYTPGWPLILSIGLIMKLPWIVSPLLGLFTLFIIYLIGTELYDSKTGLVAAVLCLFSQSYFIFTPTLMSEPATLFFSSLFFYLAVKMLKEPNRLNSLFAGLTLGILFLIRPYSAFSISLPIFIYLIIAIPFKDVKKFLLPLSILILSFLPALIMFFIYNFIQTGDALLTPLTYYNPLNTLGFGIRSNDIIIKGKPYTFSDSITNLFINLAELNKDSVLFLFIFLFFIIFNKKSKWDYLLFTILSTIIFLHMFFFFRSTRYYYPAYFALFLLSARGINLSEISFKKVFSNIPVKNLNYLFLLFIMVANIFIISPPQKILQRYELYKQYRDPFNLVKKSNLSNSVVFLKSVPEVWNNISYYVQNPLNFDGKVLFAKELGKRNVELIEYYPGKKFYIYEFDRKSKTGKLTRIN